MIEAPAKRIMASATEPPGPKIKPAIAAGAAPTTPAMPLIKASFELIVTNSPWCRTAVGTRAALPTANALPNTINMKAKGKSSRLSIFPMRNRAAIERTRLMRIIIMRRPPFALSSAGPINGPTIAKGATVKARYNPTL